MQSISHLTQRFYVVTAISNPHRYQSRYRLYDKFACHLRASGAQLLTVELAFGQRPFEVTEAGNPFHVQLRSAHELWFKENLINIGISRLPADWEYVAWVDADVAFARPDWVEETVHLLQHYPVVQLFSEAHDLGPEYQTLGYHRGFVWTYREMGQAPPSGRTEYYYGGKRNNFLWHPGFAWAARRDAIDALGGLIDWVILGSADNHMAYALVGAVGNSVHPQINAHYRYLLEEWQTRAERHIRRNIGFMEGLLLHYWHGKKRDRRYRDRWKILVANDFNPALDLKRDWQNVWQLEQAHTRRRQRLRDDIRHYFASRNEDSIDL